MHTAEDGDQPNNAVRHMKTSTVQTPATHELPTASRATKWNFAAPLKSWETVGRGGRTVAVTASTEIKAGLSIGTRPRCMPSGNRWIMWRARWPRANGTAAHDQDNGNSNDDNGNDDNGNVNSNDDNGNDDQRQWQRELERRQWQ